MRNIHVTSVPVARRAQRCCDHCGRPFGMVTHRWWGSKFCKRKCKETHIREIMLNLQTRCSQLNQRISWLVSSA